MGNRNKPKPRGKGNGEYNTGTRNWRQVLGPFTIPIGDTKNIEYQQEKKEEGAVARIGCVCLFIYFSRRNVVGRLRRLQAY